MLPQWGAEFFDKHVTNTDIVVDIVDSNDEIEYRRNSWNTEIFDFHHMPEWIYTGMQ